eukprot:gene7613-11936_t
MGSTAKNTIYMMFIVLAMDYLHLQNQILKSKYKLIYGKSYVPLHKRLSDTITKASTIAIENKKI